jgi:hypothetical protein
MCREVERKEANEYQPFFSVIESKIQHRGTEIAESLKKLRSDRAVFLS